MREIKFRAYTDGKMFHDVGVVRNIVVLECEYSEEYGDVDLEPTYYGLNDDSIKLMQFTGLHDKNGKEIYEGDIVKIDGMNCVIKYSDLSASYIAECIGEDTYWDLGVYTQKLGIEQIGNVYEHSHLLKEEVK